MTRKNNPIIDLLMQLKGIDVSKYDDSFLSKSLQKRITETNCDSAEAYYTFLELDKQEGDNFIASLHNSYSEFFRNPLTYAVLERIILPSLVFKKAKTKRKEIRIWSSACAGGQEAYSIAMMLEEKNNGDEKINYRIFATDQDEFQVNLARKGRFSDSSLNNLNMKQVTQWFTKHGSIYTIKPKLRENIDFSVFDLFSKNLNSPPESIFGDFDLVFCANLLFYYKPEYREIILEKAGKSLAQEGYLITGETERDFLIRDNYHEAFPNSAIFQKKNKM